MTSLITSANYDENMHQGFYAPLAGVSKPMLISVKNLAIPATVAINGLIAGIGIKIVAGVVTLATDDETHIVVGSNLQKVDGSNSFVAVEPLLGTVMAVEKGLARVQCEVKVAEVIIVGDSVSFEEGVLVKTVAETNSYIVEEIEGLVAQISFK